MKRLELGTKIDAMHIPGNLGIGKIVRYLDGGYYGVQFEGAAFIVSISADEIRHMISKPKPV